MSLTPQWWWRSDSLVLGNANTTIAQFNDLSGNGNHGVQAVPANQVAYNPAGQGGRPVAQYAGTVLKNIVLPSVSLGAFTIAMMCKLTGTAGYLGCINSNAVPIGAYLYGAAGNTTFVSRAGPLVAAFDNLNNWSVDNVARSVIWVYDGTYAGLNVYLGGVLMSPKTATNGNNPGVVPTAGPFYWGSNNFNATCATGQFGECIGFNYALNFTQISAVDQYMRSYWSLPTFSVASVTGLRLWLKADDATQFAFGSGNAIQSWIDQSGLGNTPIQNTPARQPIWTVGAGPTGSTNAVVFDAVDDELFKAFALTQVTTIYLVCKIVTPPVADVDVTMIDGNGANTMRIYRDRNSGTQKVAVHEGVGLVSTVTPTNWMRLQVTFQGATTTVKNLGVLNVTGNTGANNAGGITIGCLGDGVSQPSNLAIAEAIVVQGTPLPNEDTNINNYLFQKYGV